MRQKNKKFFKILPWSVVGSMVLILVACNWQILPIRVAKAAQPSLTKADILDAKPTIGLTHGCTFSAKDCAQMRKIMHNFDMKIRRFRMIKKSSGINIFKLFHL
jgi:hypothetical protein